MAFKNYFGFLLSLCCVLCFFNKIVGAHADNECQTPSGQSGKCIPILNCSSLSKLSVTVQRTYMETALLKYSVCGIEPFTYKVCCPKKDYMYAVLEENKSEGKCSDQLQSRGNLPTTEECGVDAPTPISFRIYGGDNTGDGEYTWTVLILYKNEQENYYAICGGSLINEYFVITAAHCLSDQTKSVSDYLVRLGARNKHFPIQDNEIDAIIKHPYYDESTLVNDAALLRMKYAVNYSQFKPICLPLHVSERDKPYENQQAYITGWGMTTKENQNPSNIQLKASVEIIPVVQKKNYYYCNNLTISRSKMCAKGKDHDACKGDSGGPLMIKETVNGRINWYLIGIVSYSNLDNKCGTEESIGIYARVNSFIDWIILTLKTYCK